MYKKRTILFSVIIFFFLFLSGIPIPVLFLFCFGVANINRTTRLRKIEVFVSILVVLTVFASSTNFFFSVQFKLLKLYGYALFETATPKNIQFFFRCRCFSWLQNITVQNEIKWNGIPILFYTNMCTLTLSVLRLQCPCVLKIGMCIFLSSNELCSLYYILCVFRMYCTSMSWVMNSTYIYNYNVKFCSQTYSHTLTRLH